MIGDNVHGVCFIIFFPSYGDHRDLHSFPTRRSSDLKARSREPITAKLVANLIETAGANRMIALD